MLIVLSRSRFTPSGLSSLNICTSLHGQAPCLNEHEFYSIIPAEFARIRSNDFAELALLWVYPWGVPNRKG